MGTFDGVHLGHRQLLHKVIRRAKEEKGKSVVITYYQHPKETLDPSLSPYLLTEKHKKTILLQQLGIDHIIYLKFDNQMSEMGAEEFLEKILIAQVQAKEIVFGYDCHFGHNREGDYHFLKSREKTYGYHSHLIKPVEIDGTIVSSSLIRSLIKEGNVAKANRFLGRHYELEGNIEKGSGIGSELGFPTLNLVPIDPYKLLPAKGVYLGKALFRGKEYFCLTNIGFCPTLKQLSDKTVESYLLDYDKQPDHDSVEQEKLLKKIINISFISRLRDEVEFPDKHSLIEAIRNDKSEAEKLIAQLKKK
jgi:riboflavin kinase/FMN adenylyltransferase